MGLLLGSRHVKVLKLAVGVRDAINGNKKIEYKVKPLRVRYLLRSA
jgi:hypothetical protein